MSPRTGLLSLLLPDETSRRAFDETLADWREERELAATIADRSWAEMRGVASVVRVIASEVGRELVAPEAWRLFFWTLLTAILISSLIPVVWNRALDLARNSREMLSLFAAIVSGSLALTFVIAAAAGPGQSRSRPVPTLASLVLSVAFLYLALGWFAPFAAQRAALASSERFQAADRHDALHAQAERIGEASIDQFLRQTRIEEGRAIAARRDFSLRLGFILAAPTAFMLGVAVRRRLANRMPWRLAQLTSVAALVGCVTAGIKLWPLIRDFVEPNAYIRWQRLDIELWLGIVIVWVAIAVLGRPRIESGATV